MVGETLPTPQKQVQGRLLASHPCKYHKACLRGPCIYMSVVAPLVRDNELVRAVNGNNRNISSDLCLQQQKALFPLSCK